jgi:hypothetical protein
MKIPAFVLNLTTRPDRLQEFQTSISKYKYFDVYPIISQPDPYQQPLFGCCNSHIQALVKGKESKERAFAIFEDDARFNKNRDLKDYITQIPKDWDIIVLGLNSTKTPIKINENVFKIKFLCGSHALIIRNESRVVDALIATLSVCETFCDYGYSEAIEDNNLVCYLVYPFIVTSKSKDQSNIRGGWIDDEETQMIIEESLSTLIKRDDEIN